MTWTFLWPLLPISPLEKKPSFCSNGIWHPNKLAKFEGPSGRKLVYTRDHPWAHLPSLCAYLRRNILGHYWANDERRLGASNKEGESAVTGSLRSGPLPDKSDALYQHLSLVQYLVYCANPADPKHIHPTIDNSHWMLHLERSSLPSACFDTTTTKTNARIWDEWYSPKCTALFLYHMNMQGKRDGSAKAPWLHT